MRRLYSLLLIALAGLLTSWGGPGATQQAAASAHSEPLPPNTVVETVVADAGDLVVAMAFAPDSRLFFTTKGGFAGDSVASVRIVHNGVLRPSPFLTTPVNAAGERGLLGIALDPNFPTNRYVYIFKTAPASETGSGRPASRVLRYTEDPATQTAVPGSATLLLDVPIGAENDSHTNHNGGNLHFGPDGKLYVSIGDYGRHPQNAQTLSNAMGKLHRLNPDPNGTAPADNPFVSEPADAVRTIWSYGHRNSFDFTFDPLTGRMFSTENGPQCDDEVNLGQAGGNYGWGAGYQCGVVPAGTIAPLWRYTGSEIDPLIAITGIDVYQGRIQGWHNELFWCGFNTGRLYHARLDSTRTQILDVAEVSGAPACHIDVQHSPDGAALYVSSLGSISRIRSTVQLSNFTYLPLVRR